MHKINKNNNPLFFKFFTFATLQFCFVLTLISISGCCNCKPCEVCTKPLPCSSTLARTSTLAKTSTLGKTSKETAKTNVTIEKQRWFVLRVKDGDTLVARLEEPGRAKRKETIRLLQINTPEKNKLGYEEAREALKYLVSGGEIFLEFEDPGVEKRGGFGRLLAYVIVNEKNINIEMVRLGWSANWTKYGKGRLTKEFEAAEKQARTDKKGLWKLVP